MKTIAVVDDDVLLVESLTDLLEREGYRVVSAPLPNAGCASDPRQYPGASWASPNTSGATWALGALRLSRGRHSRLWAWQKCVHLQTAPVVITTGSDGSPGTAPCFVLLSDARPATFLVGTVGRGAQSKHLAQDVGLTAIRR